MNKMILCGNVGSVDELKEITNGHVLGFTLATNEDVGKDKPKHTEWHNLKIFGNRAVGVAPHIKTGMKLLIEGKIRKRKYTNGSGEERLSVDVIVDSLEFVDKKDQSHQGAASQQSAQQPAMAGGDDDWDFDPSMP